MARGWKLDSCLVCGIISTLLSLPALSRAGEIDVDAARQAMTLAQSPELLLAQSQLELAEYTAERIAGSLEFQYGLQRVDFTCLLATPTLVELNIALGNVMLEAKADLAEDTRSLNGHDHRLSVAERLALIALYTQVEQCVRKDPTGRQPHEDFLLRVLS